MSALPDTPDASTLADPAALATLLLGELRARANPDNVAGMARYGICVDDAVGVSVPELRAMAADAKRRLGRDKPARHELALLLWDSAVHEARLMATIVDVPELVSEEQADSWASQLDSWDICDQLCNNLLRSTEVAWTKAYEWPGCEPEYVKRAGFVLGATLAVHDRRAGDGEFLPLLTLCERESTDGRNVVKKAVNWSIRQIGKRSETLNAEAIMACERILEAHPETTAARWVARDALRELRSDAIRTRLGIA